MTTVGEVWQHPSKPEEGRLRESNQLEAAMRGKQVVIDGSTSVETIMRYTSQAQNNDFETMQM